MRTIGVVTVARSDYGIYMPLLRRLRADPDLDLYLMVTGMHLSPAFGHTVDMIEADGFEVHEQVDSLLASGTPEGIAKSIGMGVIGFAQSFARFLPDILVVLGDRFEMLAAATASLTFKLPVAHLHGGESTEGLIDEPIRHSLTKMSHLHFAATEFYGRRIIQMGEEPWRVTVSGAPGLDNLNEITLLDLDQLHERTGVDFSKPTLLVTYHPVTLEYEKTDEQIDAVLAALARSEMPLVFTYPNADTYGQRIIHKIEAFVAQNTHAKVLGNLGTEAYFSVMHHAAAMVGNSSSGIIEAASFKLPVVNIGIRQRGRIHAHNVIDVECTTEAIYAAITRATSNTFREDLRNLINPYGQGNASEIIVDRLKDVSLDTELLLKRFHNI